jgi:hypothetical protein
MLPRSFAWIAAIAVVGLSACGEGTRAPEAPGPTPQPTATVVQVIQVPTPAHSSVPTKVEVMDKPTLCGAEKLQNYLNLLPTTTAKDEIVRSLGHNRVRYVPLAQEKGEATDTSARVTAGVGVDGRIKEFACG